MTCVSSHRCLGSPAVRKKEFRLKGFISLEEINLSRQKQNYRFYLSDKSWYFPVKHVIYYINSEWHRGILVNLASGQLSLCQLGPSELSFLHWVG